MNAFDPKNDFLQQNRFRNFDLNSSTSGKTVFDSVIKKYYGNGKWQVASLFVLSESYILQSLKIVSNAPRPFLTFNMSLLMVWETGAWPGSRV